METGKVVVFPHEHAAVLEDFPVPTPGPGQILVKSAYSCISAGTERKRYMNVYADSGVPQRPFPVRPGYANVGTIVELGPGVDAYQKGERILTMANHASHYLRTVDEDAIERIPPGVASEHAALGVLAQVALAGVRRAPPEIGQAALVAGQGVVGQLVVQFLKASGCTPVIATDVADFRLEKSKRSGADLTIDAAREDVYVEVMAATEGKGVERVYDATPVPDALPTNLRVAATRGIIVMLGGPMGKAELNLYADFFRRDLTLMGVYQPLTPTEATPHTPWTQQRHRQLYLTMLQDGALNVAHLITHIVPPTEATATYAMLAAGGENSLGILFDWR
ncbi:MAG: zinc-binding alcohol dehydrogenase [Chloroflexota bacterium]|nr:zinc-binding alcohol dehydrogenase [Chloroflexota bacterium]MDE2841200.1 zinc-binding alcohol dehydrogenase [Chloroflexota bacterium]MDE2929600.1 zinc-binding alcohol dehydrogenase [Chloroflexota bacterium]